MEFTPYGRNIALTVGGFLFSLDYTIRSSRDSVLTGFLHSLFGCLGGMVGLWNLICLLEKLNVIHP